MDVGKNCEKLTKERDFFKCSTLYKIVLIRLKSARKILKYLKYLFFWESSVHLSHMPRIFFERSESNLGSWVSMSASTWWIGENFAW